MLNKLGVNLGYFNGDRVLPRTVTKRDIVLYFYNNHFCLLWKTENDSFNQAIQELKNNFEESITI